jgi:protein gp37
MSQTTPIEWTDSAVNPVMGCEGCELWIPSTGVRTCYAGQLHEKRGGLPGYAKIFTIPEMFPGRIETAASWSDLTGTARPDKPWLNGRPRHIFISDMGDALSRSVPFDYLRDEIIVHVTSAKGKRHIWQWLTKQPRRMAEFARYLEAQGIIWPDNLWALTSVTSAAQLGRVKQLFEVPAKVRGVSYEPALGEVDFSPWLFDRDAAIRRLRNGPAALNWDQADSAGAPRAMCRREALRLQGERDAARAELAARRVELDLWQKRVA